MTMPKIEFKYLYFNLKSCRHFYMYLQLYSSVTYLAEILFKPLNIIYTYIHTKGRTILKGLFGVLEFSQKRTNEFVVVVKTNSFVRFLGEFEDTKSPFEII